MKLKTRNNKKTNKILIADEHPILRTGLKAILEEKGKYEVCSEVDNAFDLEKYARELQPHLIILDPFIHGIGGLEIVRDLYRTTNAQLFVLSVYEEHLYAEQSIWAGAKGYLMKGATSEELLEALQMVSKGKIYLSAPMRAKIMKKYFAVTSVPPVPQDILSQEEKLIYQQIGQGFSYQEISQHLKISQEKIKRCARTIKEKLHISDQTEFLQMAISWRL